MSSHHTLSPLTKSHKSYLPLNDCEFFCRECRAKCTVTPDGVEVGHWGDCSHRPSEFPYARPSSRSIRRCQQEAD